MGAHLTRVLIPEDGALVANFEGGKLQQNIGAGSEDIVLQSWTAPWREESLNYYLPLGWSYGVFSGEKLLGYTLGQPLLFFDNQTQSLWVEHVSYVRGEVLEELVEASYNWSRSKHFQRLYFRWDKSLKPFVFQEKYVPWADGVLYRQIRGG